MRVMLHISMRSICGFASLGLVGLVIGGVVFAGPLSTTLLRQDEFTDHATAPAGANAIILFIGDGMGEAYRTAARWATVGQSGDLAMDTTPFSGWARTASANSPVTDSAAAATALATGIRTNNGRIGQDPSGNPLTTILERAKAKGLAVGLVTTTQMAHASPAAFAAHVPHRSMMTEIASQTLAAEVDVLLGGGEDEFLPITETGCYPEPGERTDGRNLIGEALAAGYTYVCDATTFAAIDPASTTHLLGLFADEGMTRPFAPSLAEMTQIAIDILSQDPDGFFLMVEGGQIDWAGHANDATNAISDTIGFDQAVAVAQAYASTNGNVLIVVTADHETGGMSVDLVSSGSPSEDGPFYMPDGTLFYVNWTTGGHTAADVPTTAQGPWSGWLTDTYTNTHIHDVMHAALKSWIQIDISGPTTGISGTAYTFTAAVSPITATLPFTYSWQATKQVSQTSNGDLSDIVTFAWGTTGTQMIAVEAANAEGTVTDSHFLALYAPVQAGFTATPTNGVAPLTVRLANTSIGDYTGSLWDFGDGITATQSSPTHTYAFAGAFSVTLTISGPGGTDTLTRANYIFVASLGPPYKLHLPLVLRQAP